MKKEVIEELQKIVLNKSKELREDKNISTDAKIEDSTVYLNIFKFLEEYDENIEVLNRYHIKKHEKEKSERSERS